MKKVILSVFVVAALMATSCKKAKDAANDAATKTEETGKKVVNEADKAANKVVEETKQVVDKAASAVQSAIEGVSIPAFADAKVTEHVKAYAEYAKKYIDAKGDVVKNSGLAKEGVKLAEQGAALVKTMDADTKKKFDGVMNAIKAKMAPAKK